MKFHPVRFPAYCIVLVLCIIWASFMGGALPYLCLFSMALYLPVSLIYMLVSYHMLMIYQEITDHRVMKGEEQPWKLMLENTGPVRVNDLELVLETALSEMTVPENAAKAPLLCLVPGERAELSGSMICRFAGTYRVGMTHVAMRDPFAVMTLQREVPSPLRVTVMPRITDIANAVLDFENLRNSSRMKSVLLREPVPGNDIRPYQRGDSLRSIHWKASAAAGTLQTRIPEVMDVRRIVLIMAAEYVSPEEKAGRALRSKTPGQGDAMQHVRRRDYFLEFAVSAAWYHAVKGENLLIIYPRGSIRQMLVNSPESFLAFYEEIAKGPFYNREEDAAAILESAQTVSEDGQTGVIITLRESEYPTERFLAVRVGD